MISNGVSCFVLLPHADDEAFVFPELRVLFPDLNFYLFLLTEHVNHVERLTETKRALTLMGYPLDRLADLRLSRDGCLPMNLEKAFAVLCGIIESRATEKFDLICPAWEGGHQDHDASYVIVKKLQKHFSSRCEIRVFWLYNGLGTRGKFFRIAHSFGPSLQRGFLKWRSAIRSLIFPFLYPSQRKTWLGLGPGYIMLRLVRKKLNLSIRHVPPPLTLPHPGGLLYERWGRLTWIEFKNLVEKCWPNLFSE